MPALPGRSAATLPPFPRPGALVRVRGRLGLPETTATPPPEGLPAVVVGRLGASTLLVLVTRWGRAIADLHDVREVAR